MKNTLSSLSIKNFTVFQSEKLDFGTKLNVIVGENGTGKSHLLTRRLVASVGFDEKKI